MKINYRFLLGLALACFGVLAAASAGTAEEAAPQTNVGTVQSKAGKNQYRELVAEVDSLKRSRKLDEAQAKVEKILQLPGLTAEQKQDAFLATADYKASREGPSCAAAILKQALNAAPRSAKAPAIKATLERLEPIVQAEATAVRLKLQVEKASGSERLELLDQLLDAYARVGNRIAGKDQSADVRKWCKEIIDLDPENKAGLKRKYAFRARLDDAQKFFLGRRFAEAEAAADNVLAMKDLSPDEFQRASLLKSNCSIAKKDYDASIRCLRKALDVAHDGPNAAVLKFLIQRSEKMREAEQGAAAGGAQGVQANATGKFGPYKVSDGTAEQLFAYIEGLKRGRPEHSKDLPAPHEPTQMVNAAILEAADKILAAKPTSEQTAKALQLELAAISSQPAYFIDAKTMAKLEQLIGQLENAKLLKEARDARRLFLTCKVRSVSFRSRHEELAQVVNQIKDFFASGPPDPSWTYLATTAGRAVEQTGKADFAAKTYRDLRKIFMATGDKSLADTAVTFEGAARRVELVGHPMLVEGTTLDGRPLDWTKYSGKVVLVDFWATWCGPYRDELPIVKKAYATYHDRGFEVVGISLDQSREALNKFVKSEKLPWAIVQDSLNISKASATSEGEKIVNTATASQGLARYYGIFAVPTAILLGKDGKAVSLDARAEVLTRELEKLFGPASEKKE
jgi:thiol-disulfide isomerase/thioredoxin